MRRPAWLRLPRWMHRIYARMFGYFWSPCPICRRPFGGHEWRNHDGMPSSVYRFDVERDAYIYTGICPDCTRAGKGARPGARYDEGH